jgi:iron(III) transport system ATP-binding protein
MIRIEDLRLTYHSRGTDHAAVRGISLTVEQGEFCTLLGPSGCGKTTTLRCVAGLERPDSGRIAIGDRTVFSSDERIWVPPADRNIGMVFQSYAIWPHMTVAENVAFPLRYLKPRPSRAEMRARVGEALAMVKLEGLEDRPAPFLSGGQQQRLALARALVAEPRVLLLDEPLSNLDAKLREQMRLEIRDLAKRLDVTTLFVTHEQVEALTMSDVVVVMKDGLLVQRGAPREIYNAPSEIFVAAFVGKINFVPGRILSVSGEGNGRIVSVDTPIGRLTCDGSAPGVPGDSVTMAVRPEEIVLGTTGHGVTGPGAGNEVEGEVSELVYLGNLLDCSVRVGDQTMHVQLLPAAAPAPGSRVFLRFATEGLRIVQP